MRILLLLGLGLFFYGIGFPLYAKQFPDSNILYDGIYTVVRVSGNARCAVTDRMVSIHYDNVSVPPNAQVILHHGWTEYWWNSDWPEMPAEIVRWRSITDIDMERGDDGRYSASISNEDLGYSEMQFALKIVLPDGRVFWDNAGSHMGYYELEFRAQGMYGSTLGGQSHCPEASQTLREIGLIPKIRP
jgi:hypothetical protein